MGPLSFLIFINDLSLYIQSTSTSVYLYANNTCFYCSNHDKSVLERNLQRWCRENGMVLNTDKTKVIILTSRQKRTVLNDAVLNLQYSDNDISMSTCDKIRTYLSTEHRVLFYNAYIKPHLDYCSLLWSNTSNININKISRLQRRSCKLILGIEFNGLIDAFQRLKMLSFDQSIFLSEAKMMHKIHNNIAPSYLNEMLLMRDTTLNNTASNLRSVASKKI